MKHYCRISVRRVLLLSLIFLRWWPDLARSAPQDNWTLDFTFAGIDPADPPTGAYIVAQVLVDSENDLYAIDHVSGRIVVCRPNGIFKSKFETVSYISVATFGPDGRLYLSADYDSSVYVYEKTGTQVRRIGVGQLSRVYGIAVDTNGDIYVSEFDAPAGNIKARVTVYSSSGTLLRRFGEAGEGPGQLSYPTGIVFSPQGELCVFAHGTLQRFAKDGTFLGAETGVAGAILGSVVGFSGIFRGAMVDGTWLFSEAPYLRFPDGTWSTNAPGGVGCNPRTGMIYGSSFSGQLGAWRRGFRTLGAVPPKLVPVPAVRAIAQRADGYVNIDYLVVDGDSATVSTALAAFKRGSSLLRDMIPLTAATLVENTAANVGDGIPTGEIKRVTWNPASANLASGDMVVEVFARDDRANLIDIDFVKLPTTPALTIGRSPLTHADLREVWAWLMIRGTAELSRAADGEITGPGGAFTTTAVSSGNETTWTTDAGRAWLFAKLGVREATADEVTLARRATSTGTPNQFVPTKSQQMGGRPKAVNEWTFDSSDQYGAEAWWVVPKQ